MTYLLAPLILLAFGGWLMYLLARPEWPPEIEIGFKSCAPDELFRRCQTTGTYDDDEIQNRSAVR